MQLINPNVQNSPHHPPKTTVHALSPPSGKSAGFMPGGPAFAGGGCTPVFSRSASATVSGSRVSPRVECCWDGMRSIEGRCDSLYGVGSVSFSVLGAILLCALTGRFSSRVVESPEWPLVERAIAAVEGYMGCPSIGTLTCK